jgi:hypothetical protein
MLQQDYTQWHLVEGAIARLGKGKVCVNHRCQLKALYVQTRKR